MHRGRFALICQRRGMGVATQPKNHLTEPVNRKLNNKLYNTENFSALSTHKTKLFAAFLAARANVQMHLTPTYTPWLNQVGNWFSKVQRQATARCYLRSRPDPRSKLLRYIRHYNKAANPIKWTCANPKQRNKT